MAEELNDNSNAAVAATPPPQAESEQKSSATESRPQTASTAASGGLGLLIVRQHYDFGNRTVIVYDILGDGAPADGHDSIQVKTRSLVQISGRGLGIYDKVILRVDTKGYRPVYLKRSDRQISFKIPNFDSVYQDGQRIYIELYSSEVPSAAVRTNQYLTYKRTSEEERKKQTASEGGEKKEAVGRAGEAGGVSSVKLAIGAAEETLGGVVGGLAAGFSGQTKKQSEKDFEPQEVVTAGLNKPAQLAAEDTEDVSIAQAEQTTVESSGGATGLVGSTGGGVFVGESGTVQGRESVRSETVAGGTAAVQQDVGFKAQVSQTASQSTTAQGAQVISQTVAGTVGQAVSQGGTISGRQVISESGTVSSTQGFQVVSEGSVTTGGGLGIRVGGTVSGKVTAPESATVTAGAVADQGVVSGEIKTTFAPISGEQRQSLIDQSLALVDSHFERLMKVQAEAHPEWTSEQTRAILQDRAIGDVGVTSRDEGFRRLGTTLQQIDGQSWGLNPKEADQAIGKMTWGQLRRALVDAKLSGAKIGDIIKYVLRTNPLPQGKVESEGPPKKVVPQAVAGDVLQAEAGAVAPKEKEFAEKLEALRKHDRAFQAGVPIDSLSAIGPGAPPAAQVPREDLSQVPTKPTGASAEKPDQTLPAAPPAKEPLAGPRPASLPTTEPPVAPRPPLAGMPQNEVRPPSQEQSPEANGGAVEPPPGGGLPQTPGGKGVSFGSSAEEAVKSAVENKLAKLASPALERAVFWIWGTAIPSFGLSILVGAIIGDIIWIAKSTLLSFRLKLHVLAMNLVIILLVLLVVLVLGVTVKYFCDNWLTYGVAYLSGSKEICDAFK